MDDTGACWLGLISTYVHPELTWDEWDQVILRLLSWRPFVRIDAPWKYQSASFIPAKLGGKCRPFSSYYRVCSLFCFEKKNDDGTVGRRAGKCSTSWRFTRWWHGQLAAVNGGSNEQICLSFGAGCCPAQRHTKRANSNRTDWRTRLAFLKFPDTRYHFDNERTVHVRPETTFCVGAIQSFEG